MAYAFQCKNCGRLVSSADAGERHLPASCPSCGSGVSFDPKTGIKTFDDDNWQPLSDLPADERKALAEDHGVPVTKLIETHVPAEPDANPDHEPTSISVEADEGLTTEDQP